MVAFFLKLLSAGVALISNIYITNNLNIESAGAYFFMLAIILFINPFGILGLNNLVLKNISRINSFSDRFIANSLMYRCVIVSFIFSTLIVAVFVFIWYGINSVFLVEGVSFQTFFYLILSVPFFACGTILCHGIQALGSPKISVLVSGPLFQSCIFFMFYFFNAKTPELVALSYFLSAIGLFLTSLLFWMFNNGVRCGEQNSGFGIINDGFPFMSIQIIGVVYISSSQVILGYQGNLVEVAIFAICMKISLMLSFILQAVNKIVAPQFSSLYHANQKSELGLLVKRSTKLLILVTLPLVLFLICFASEILQLFGDDYIAGYWILISLVLAQFFNICTGNVSFLLMMTGHEKFHRNNVAIASIVSLIIGLLLIPKHTLFGALIMVSSTLILTNILSWWTVMKKLQINTFRFI